MTDVTHIDSISCNERSRSNPQWAAVRQESGKKRLVLFLDSGIRIHYAMRLVLRNISYAGE